jgi:hypothetical protein
VRACRVDVHPERKLNRALGFDKKLQILEYHPRREFVKLLSLGNTGTMAAWRKS